MRAQRPVIQVTRVAAVLNEANGIPVLVPFRRGDGTEVIPCPTGEGAEINAATPRCPHLCCGCADVAHELANSVTAVLIIAQVLEWKLPPYSWLKRTVREIERHAQRSGAILKGLLSRFERNEAGQDLCGHVPSLYGTLAAVTAQGLVATDEGKAKLPPQPPSPTAPGRGFCPEKELTSVCDRCTSAFFPKEER